MRVEIVRTLQALAAIEADWVGLTSHSRYFSPFQTFDWVYACCQWVEKADDLFIIAVRDGTRLIGLAPLVLCTEQFGAKSLRFIGMGISDYLTCLAEAGQEEIVLDSIMHTLLDCRQLWDSVILRDLPGSMSNLDALSTQAVAVGFHLSFPSGPSTCWELSLPSSWEEYLANLSSELRSSMERKARKLRREFAVRVEDMALSPAWKGGLQTLFDLHQERWTSKGRPGAFAEGRIQQLHRQVVAAFRTRGWVSLPVIFANDQPIAAIYLFRMWGTVYYYLSGCRTDAPWNRYSVGLQVLREAIKHAIETGATTFDFMRGAMTYKERLGAKPVENVNIVLFHSRTRYLAYKAMTIGRQVLKTKAPQPLKRVAKKLFSQGM